MFPKQIVTLNYPVTRKTHLFCLITGMSAPLGTSSLISVVPKFSTVIYLKQTRSIGFIYHVQDFFLSLF